MQLHPLDDQSPVTHPLPPDGWIRWLPSFLPDRFANHLLATLPEQLAWTSRSITLFGKTVLQPRLVAWYGDPGVTYRYSGSTWEAAGWPPPLADLRDRLRETLGEDFNSVLCNLYRDGGDSMGWHADNEPELGLRPTIASVSLGGCRRFSIRPRDRHQAPAHLALQHGSLLVMGGDMQQHWQHAVPKTRRPVAARINLTFRRIKDH